MPKKETTVSLKIDYYLTCQNCFEVCLPKDVGTGDNCPHCGLLISNWREVLRTINTKEEDE